jgi:hypothetical protein
VQHLVLPLQTISGLSGLTADDRGELWAVPEDDRFLVAIEPARGRVRTLPLEGVPPGVDLESIAWLPDGRFAVGSERDGDRDADLLFLVARTDDRARVVARLEASYRPLGMRARDNHGVEGLCAAGATLLWGGEPVRENGARRQAPLGRIELDTGRQAWFALRLTTPTGKLSALDCQRHNGALEVLAVERHFGVSRLLGFRIPDAASGGELVPVLRADLAALVPEGLNFEGVARWRGQVALVVDNAWRTISGPNQLLLLTLPAPRHVPHSQQP